MQREHNSIEYAREVVGKDPMARHLGIEVTEVRENYSRLELIVRPEHLNALDRAHGILVYAMVDQAIAVAANAGGGSAMLLETKVNFINGVPLGARLVAEAKPLQRRRKIGCWQVEVREKESGVYVAAGQGTSYHKE